MYIFNGKKKIKILLLLYLINSLKKFKCIVEEVPKPLKKSKLEEILNNYYFKN